MKVFVLGGYGKVGVPTSELLLSSGLVDQLAVAGRDLQKAEQMVAGFGARAIAVQADGNDTESLARALEGYDLVVNASSTEANAATINAAARAGVHYCDATTFGDALGPTLELDPVARRAGITAVVAAGIGPCLSNLMAVRSAAMVDQVRQLQRGMTGLFSFVDGSELAASQWSKDPAASLEVLRRYVGHIRMMLAILHRDGRRLVWTHTSGTWREIDPMAEGLGLRHVGATERAIPFACTDSFWGGLPDWIGSEAPVDTWFSPLPPQLDHLLNRISIRVADEKLEVDAALDEFFGQIETDPARWLTSKSGFMPAPKMWTRAVGTRDGRPAQATLYLSDPMNAYTGWYITSVALAVVALSILQGATRAPGVVAAERIMEPAAFFEATARILPDFPDGEAIVVEEFELL